MMKRDSKLTIVYGGGFNPPTLAHERILKEVLDYAETVNAEVWVLPSGDRVDKSISTVFGRRVQYVEALIEDSEPGEVKVRVVLTELTRDHFVETYDTIMEFEEDYPDRDFMWVFGADSVQTMSSWKKGDWLLKNVKMLVCERPGFDVVVTAEHAVALPIPAMDVSSTAVRECIAKSESFEHLVGVRVHKLLNA